MGKNPNSIDDLEIFDIITDLNKREYIQTIFCCSGHHLWEDRKNWNLPYIEYYSYNKEGYNLTKNIEKQILKELPENTPRIVPEIKYHKDSSLRFSGIYQGDLNIPEEDIKKSVNHFWSSFRKGINNFNSS